MKQFPAGDSFTRAVTRQPAESLGAGQTTARLGAPDHDLAMAQFRAYVQALGECGLQVQVLDPLPEYPDAHFVEDTAVVTATVAVICRPGAPSRLGEQIPMEPVLAEHRPVSRIEAPGTLDGGDVLMLGNHFLVGVSDRTNEEGAHQLGRVLENQGHTWQPVTVGAGLHLKSSVSHIGDGTLLVTPEFADHQALADFDKRVAPAGEDYACNLLIINGRVLMPAGYPLTCELLAKRGLPVITLDTSEFRKMDGGLSCLSLRF
jgi:dimethylargininase